MTRNEKVKVSMICIDSDKFIDNAIEAKKAKGRPSEDKEDSTQSTFSIQKLQHFFRNAHSFICTMRVTDMCLLGSPVKQSKLAVDKQGKISLNKTAPRGKK
jgi:hypothetical protein